jgi:hypothetical protein
VSAPEKRHKVRGQEEERRGSLIKAERKKKQAQWLSTHEVDCQHRFVEVEGPRPQEGQ